MNVVPDAQNEAHPAAPGLAPAAGTLGAILVAAGRLDAAHADRVAKEQLSVDAPFGEIAIRMGVLQPADVEFALSQQFALPCLRADDPGVDPSVIAAFNPTHEVTERMRGLRSQILAQDVGGLAPHRCVALLGLELQDGASFVAANLATVFAQLGARTLLIDADLDNPKLHTVFRTSNRVGLSSILAGRATLAAVREIAGLPGLFVLPAGPRPPNGDDLLARSALFELLRFCEREYDIVILDTAAWSKGHAASAVAAAAEAAVLVVQEGKTLAQAASALVQSLNQRKSRVLGVVINRH